MVSAAFELRILLSSHLHRCSGTWYDSTVISLALVSGNTTTANILANNITRCAK